MQWSFSGSRGCCRNQLRQRMPELVLEDGNRRSGSGQNVRRPAAADRSHLRLLMLRCRSATAPLLLQGDGESPGFLPQLQDVSVAEQDAVVGVKDEHESGLVLKRISRKYEPQRLEVIFAVDFEAEAVCVLHIGTRRYECATRWRFARNGIVIGLSTELSDLVEDIFGK